MADLEDKHSNEPTGSLQPIEDGKGGEKKLKYPKSVFFIVSNEFCERFSFYGMRTVLSLYLTQELAYSEEDAKVVFHVFTMLVYFFPVLGAMIADSLLGKFRTIFYISIIYAIGSVIISLAAVPPLNLPVKELTLVGLLLNAIGAGGIKPCVSAFGGDQFVLPQQQLQLAKFFSIFYFSVNSGSFVSTLLTPIFREDVECFDQESCYPLAFGVPGLLMVISIVIFVLGRPLYTIKKPTGNMLLLVSKCIGHALRNKISGKTVEKKEHWLDYADDKFDKAVINDTKILLKVLLLYVPLPLFWALFDQQGTGWTFQASRMQGDIGFYSILPDQLQIINPILILLFIPLFEYVIYPACDKMGLIKTHLQRLVVGGTLAGISFIISACVELELEKTYPVLPASDQAHLRVYNGLPCDMSLTSKDLNLNDIPLPIGGLYENTKIKIKDEEEEFTYELNGCFRTKGTFELKGGELSGYFITQLENGNKKVLDFEDDIEKSVKGYPRMRTLASTKTYSEIYYKNSDGEKKIETNSSKSYIDLEESKAGEFTVFVNNKKILKHNFELGAVYTVVIVEDPEENYNVAVHEITSPNSMHMLWLVPQYVVLTAGEVMFSVTGLQFSYKEAPLSMKSVIAACWHLTTAFGNLIIVIISKAKIFDSQAKEFFLYAGLMIVDMAIFAVMAYFYKPSNAGEKSEEGDNGDDGPKYDEIEEKTDGTDTDDKHEDEGNVYEDLDKKQENKGDSEESTSAYYLTPKNNDLEHEAEVEPAAYYSKPNDTEEAEIEKELIEKSAQEIPLPVVEDELKINQKDAEIKDESLDTAVKDEPDVDRKDAEIINEESSETAIKDVEEIEEKPVEKEIEESGESSMKTETKTEEKPLEKENEEISNTGEIDDSSAPK